MLQKACRKLRHDGLIKTVQGGYRLASLDFRASATARLPWLASVCYSKPCIIGVETSNVCNLNCAMCYARQGRSAGFMSMDLFQHTIKEVVALSNPDINLCLSFTGEPLLHPEFKKMLAFAGEKARNLYNVEFFTNGMLFDEAVTESVVENHLGSVTWSIDGIAKTQEKIRVGSSYRQIEDNLNYLLHHRSNGRPYVYIYVTISTQSDWELQAIQDAWGTKVDKIVYTPSVDASTFHISCMPQLLKFNRELALYFINQQFCKMPFYSLLIHWNGNVSFCCHDMNGIGTIGNIQESKLLDLWRGPKLKRLRRHLLAGKFKSDELCGRCRKFTFEATL